MIASPPEGHLGNENQKRFRSPFAKSVPELAGQNFNVGSEHVAKVLDEEPKSPGSARLLSRGFSSPALLDWFAVAQLSQLATVGRRHSVRARARGSRRRDGEAELTVSIQQSAFISPSTATFSPW